MEGGHWVGPGACLFLSPHCELFPVRFGVKSHRLIPVTAQEYRLDLEDLTVRGSGFILKRK